jgi:D-arginine dehydrogenase
MGTQFDIIIVGGGIAGVSLGAELAGRRRVLLLEAEDQCGYHSTGRSAAFYLESYGGPVVAQLTLASGPFLSNPPADFAAQGLLRRRGALHLGRGEWPEVPPSVEARRLDGAGIARMIPGIRPEWDRGLLEPGCADIDVARLHAGYLAVFRRAGGDLRTGAEVVHAERVDDVWHVQLRDGTTVEGALLVNATGAWADSLATACSVAPLRLQPKRRTLVQLKVGVTGLRDLPLIIDWRGSFYFMEKGESSIWLSPHDEIDTEPCDAAPEEIDIAVAIDRFERVVDWPVDRVERSWAGLRTFAPDRIPVYGFDVRAAGFFWCAGQGGFGIQTAPAAAKMAASLITGDAPDPMVAGIDPTPFLPNRF